MYTRYAVEEVELLHDYIGQTDLVDLEFLAVHAEMLLQYVKLARSNQEGGLNKELGSIKSINKQLI